MSPGADSILSTPQAGHGLLLSIEVETRLAVEGVGTAASNALLVSGEGEHGEGHGDGDIDTDLAGFAVLLEAGGGRAGAGEDGGSVAVFILVDEVNGVVEGVDGEAD